ncbi:MAG: hypothetical protein OXE85_13410 [Roseovarius sp.]|nr:hypothetical protein [Roseovarius sp.]
MANAAFSAMIAGNFARGSFNIGFSWKKAWFAKNKSWWELLMVPLATLNVSM